MGSVDLYDFLVKGDNSSDINLHPNDVVLVGLSEKNIQNPGYTDAIGCSFFDYQEFSDEISHKQGKKQKKQGFKGFFSWLDQYI